MPWCQLTGELKLTPARRRSAMGSRGRHQRTQNDQAPVPEAMAAEMSTGMLGVIATNKSKPSVSMLVTHLEADFVKKATGLTTFTCNQGKELTAKVEEAILTGQGTTFEALSIGTSEKGEEEARFRVQWSFKARMK